MNERPGREENPDIGRHDRDVAIEGLRSAVAQSEASGEAAPFDMDAWLEDQDRLDCSLREGLESGEAIGFDVNEWLEAKRTGPGREEAA
jgi:Arc/MetJ-type ribon-helix-helix transcriptional regulator